MPSTAIGKPDKNSELGTLIVVLLKARNLNDKHSFWKQDVFAQAILNSELRQLDHLHANHFTSQMYRNGVMWISKVANTQSGIAKSDSQY